MKSIKQHAITRLTAMALSGLMTFATTSPMAWAASHREAPLIALDPAADNTDTYMFRSWQDPSKIVFIMNVIPGNPGPQAAFNPRAANFQAVVPYFVRID